jgi:hypothetical protein
MHRLALILMALGAGCIVWAVTYTPPRIWSPLDPYQLGPNESFEPPEDPPLEGEAYQGDDCNAAHPFDDLDCA